MVASGEWCWGTSFYHKRITMDFFYSVVQLHFTIGQENPSLFLLSKAYTVRYHEKGGTIMHSSDDPRADLDDLIFEKGDGGPSER